MRIEDDSNFFGLDSDLLNKPQDIQRRGIVQEPDSPMYENFSDLAGHIRSKTELMPEFVSS